ncbi:DNA cytosine methyltransferase [Pontibacter sp. KCTC 32443]|uniref:DNA cytosine methyltransferase n=1 Tax=Pontibacter TaxID=323449 RepID=UPI00164E120A|nr:MULTISPECIES: DNA cytosine methyltransferase [Pontibacter]MBC5774346.1 DNA cytosine methyltransferase [Pontibacter sp. KCTC 32443]
MKIPVIDIFAGPGGLGEGFSALLNAEGTRAFDIALSVEKEEAAHQTLTLRSFFRQFEPGTVPEDYYSFVKGEITIQELYRRWPQQASLAKEEAWLATLGDGEDAVPFEEVDSRIKNALKGHKNWLLIGGPPCQAYSIVGRSRRKDSILDEEKDVRVGLYRQYLRILAVHNPAVFVMENVKGLLSAKTKESSVFTKILNDLSDPVKIFPQTGTASPDSSVCPGYRIYSLVEEPASYDLNYNPVYNQKNFVIQAEKYGIPQTRHRVILLGVRKDINFYPGTLKKVDEVAIAQVLHDLPGLRSGLSKQKDNLEAWRTAISGVNLESVFPNAESCLIDEIKYQVKKIREAVAETGTEFLLCDKAEIGYEKEWFTDSRIGGVCNHSARGHMNSDLLRYLFVSSFARVYQRSPKLEDFPVELLPAHKNVKEGIDDKKFADRFRVQLWDKPSKTITSHISKDGHYYIHPDPVQCRSLTVREAARIQTFPDNYFFCGPRTSQFIQVGNAVPPLLANKIARLVLPVFSKLENETALSTGSDPAVTLRETVGV